MVSEVESGFGPGTLPGKSCCTTTKNSGTKKIARTVAVIMPPITPVPMAFWAPEPAPLLRASGSTPKMKAREVIRIGRSRSRARFQGGLDQSHAVLHLLLGELHDQDGVFGRQADGGQDSPIWK